MADFFGRREELAWLRGLWDGCTQRDANTTQFIGGPRMAFIIAETGIGKSRLVQELYRQLTNDSGWDPPEINYWPEAFQGAGEQIRVNPDCAVHEPHGPPQFMWLGMRWQPLTGIRNVDEHVCQLPQAREALRSHVAITDRHRTAWEHVQIRTAQAIKHGGVGAVIGEVAGMAMPLGGLSLDIIKGAKNLSDDRTDGARSVAGESEKRAVDAGEEFVSQLSQVLSSKRALPTILWLDDAQWIDPITLQFVHMLWQEATVQKWPLFIVVTHWEREWRELMLQQGLSQRLTEFEGKSESALPFPSLDPPRSQERRTVEREKGIRNPLGDQSIAFVCDRRNPQDLAPINRLRNRIDVR